MAKRKGPGYDSVNRNLEDFLSGEGRYVDDPFSPRIDREKAPMVAGAILYLMCEPHFREGIIQRMRISDSIKERLLREAMDMIKGDESKEA